MGERKRRLRVLLGNSKCIFCGGGAPATTEDHQPARSLFDRRQWPEGYAFPACEPCNRASKDAEHKLAILVRFNAQAENDPIREKEFNKYLVGMRNNFPDLVKPLSANEKRHFLKSAGLTRPPNLALGDIHAAGIEAEAAEELFDTAMKKLLRALHWKHTGNIVRFAEGVKLLWYTNAYFHVFFQSDEAKFYTHLPALPPITRNKRDLSDQFAYRYGKDDSGDLSAFFIGFRNSIIVTGVVAQSDDVLKEIRARHALEGSTVA